MSKFLFEDDSNGDSSNEGGGAPNADRLGKPKLGSYSSAAKKAGERRRQEVYTQAERNRLKSVRQVIGQVIRAPGEELKRAMIRGVSIPTVVDVLMAHAPLAYICPLCKRQQHAFRDFTLLCQGLPDLASNPTNVACNACCQQLIGNGNIRIAGFDYNGTVGTGTGTGVMNGEPVNVIYSEYPAYAAMSDLDLTVLPTTLQRRYVELCNEAIAKNAFGCQGVPIYGEPEQISEGVSFDNSIQDWLPCEAKLLSDVQAHSAYVSRLGVQCSKCAAISRGRQSGAIEVRDRKERNITADTRYRRHLAYQYARRVIAERALYVLEVLGGHRQDQLRCDVMERFVKKVPETIGLGTRLTGVATPFKRPNGRYLWLDWTTKEVVHSASAKASALGAFLDGEC